MSDFTVDDLLEMAAIVKQDCACEWKALHRCAACTCSNMLKWAARRPSRCVMSVYCTEHNFVHGGEATELRERLEKLIEFSPTFGDYSCLLGNVRYILDDVDARDSVMVSPAGPNGLDYETKPNSARPAGVILEDAEADIERLASALRKQVRKHARSNQ